MSETPEIQYEEPKPTYRTASVLTGLGLGGIGAWAAIAAFPGVIPFKNHYTVLGSMAICSLGLLAMNFNKLPTVKPAEKK